MPNNTEKLDEVSALARRLLVQVETIQADIKRLDAQHDLDVKALEGVKVSVQTARSKPRLSRTA